jgi:ubiquinone/menaquinone biosynthesis C-methylase UbiE
MQRLEPHALLPRQSSEEESRHAFLIEIKNMLSGELAEGVRAAWERSARPAFRKLHGRDPQDRHEAGKAMRQEPYYQMWSALGRIQQEIYVDSTAACVERQLPALVEKYRSYAAGPKLGSLRLDPDLVIPRYISAVDIHCVPGGYFVELGEDDVYVGARYDIGSFIFGRGLRGPLNDSRGLTGVKYVKEHWPDLKPTRILDMGCAAGMNTLPYCDAFPDAEVHAVDVSAPALRYAHARAESLGRTVHFSQQNAESTDFEDASFDLIVSHILFHESSRKGVAGFIKECHRLLKPGGAMVHLDVPRRLTCKTPFDQFMADWDTFNNNEPFWGSFLFDIDMIRPAVDAGFAAEDVSETLAPTPSGKSNYWAYAAVKRGAP